MPNRRQCAALHGFCFAITLFLIGMLVARFVIARLLLATLKKTGLRDGVAFTVSHLLYYVTLAILLLVAISYAGIPFTIFAFFGGALAIAAGFGSQKILNNFLSGVILLIALASPTQDLILHRGRSRA